MDDSPKPEYYLTISIAIALAIILYTLVYPSYKKSKTDIPKETPKQAPVSANSTTTNSLTINRGVSDDFPKGIILEENETLVYTNIFTTPLGQKSISASYTADKKIVDVVTTYEESLTKNGWTVISKVNTPKPKSTVIKAIKDKQTLTIAFLALSETKTALSFNLASN